MSKKYEIISKVIIDLMKIKKTRSTWDEQFSMEKKVLPEQSYGVVRLPKSVIARVLNSVLDQLIINFTVE